MEIPKHVELVQQGPYTNSSYPYRRSYKASNQPLCQSCVKDADRSRVKFFPLWNYGMGVMWLSSWLDWCFFAPARQQQRTVNSAICVCAGFVCPTPGTFLSQAAVVTDYNLRLYLFAFIVGLGRCSCADFLFALTLLGRSYLPGQLQQIQ